MLKDNEIVGETGKVINFLETEASVYGHNWSKEIAVLRMLSIHEKECPSCTGAMVQPFVALSRRDNTTEICSECGQLEAMQDLLKVSDG